MNWNWLALRSRREQSQYHASKSRTSGSGPWAARRDGQRAKVSHAGHVTLLDPLSFAVSELRWWTHEQTTGSRNKTCTGNISPLDVNRSLDCYKHGALS